MCSYYIPSFDFEDIDQKLPPSTMHNNPVRGPTTPRNNHLMLTKKWIWKPKDVNGQEPGRNWFTKFTSYLESLWMELNIKWVNLHKALYMRHVISADMC